MRKPDVGSFQKKLDVLFIIALKVVSCKRYIFDTISAGFVILHLFRFLCSLVNTKRFVILITGGKKLNWWQKF